ncbi:toxin VasX [Fulvivirga sediminis]|uniref:Toxin VasX N-terminal region domain-containing protein n=1 Tax=Fulvivirga sediminis TaxID=2803949 RepID=A0A937K363_9BACT|nr:toxin VasX [Fulvivirga sediminis]MBL3659080.1 hypothetical protein [Fulvivirga sediminis]
MVTDEIVKNQEKEAQLCDAKYTVVASGAGATCEEKPEMEALLPGIRLRFLRYGLFPKNDPDVKAIRMKDRSDDQFTLDDADASNGDLKSNAHLRVMATHLREGYVYLINHEDKSDFHELAVDEFGDLSPVIWSKNNLEEDGRTPKDFREPKEEKGLYKLVPKSKKEGGKKYWIGYSPVQWSYELHKRILNGSDQVKKNFHMILVECKGIKNKDQSCSEHVLSYQKVQIGFNAVNATRNKYKDILKQIHATERDESKQGGNVLFEDMFITLHDPVGCAADISEVLAEEVISFKALTEAIQTGETVEKALARLTEEDPCEPEIDKTYHDMFTLALTSYKLAYSDKKSTELYDGGDVGWWGNINDTHFPYQPNNKATYEIKFNQYAKYSGVYKVQTNNYVPDEWIGNGLHRDKVEGVLGVHERRAKRKTVNTLRDEYGNFIQTEYYKKALDHFTENSPEHFMEGINQLYEQILLLYNNPDNIDRHLLLPESNELEVDVYHSCDSWTEWVDGYFQDEECNKNDNISLLLNEEITIKQELLKNLHSLLYSLAGVAYARLEVHTRVAQYKVKAKTDGLGRTNYYQVLKDRRRHVMKNLNKITVRRTVDGVVTDVFHYGNSQRIEIDAALMGFKHDPNLEIDIISEGKKVETIKADSFTHRMLYGKESIAEGGKNMLTSGEELQPIKRREYYKNDFAARNYNAKAAKFLNSRGFNRVLTGLQIYNFSHSLQKVFSDNQTQVELGKNVISTIGVTAELAEAALRLKEAHLKAVAKQAGKQLSREIAQKLGGRIKIAGALGGAISSGMSFWDGALAFNKRDQDAGFAYMGAGIALAYSTAVGLWGTTGLLLLSGPAGWIALFVGLGFTILAIIFTDTDLENFFKHFLLSDAEDIPKRKLTPMEYNRHLIEEYASKIDKDDEDLQALAHPTDALSLMHDLLVCTEINYYIPKDGLTLHYFGRSAYKLANKIRVRLVFNQLLTDVSQLEAIGILLNDDEKPEPFIMEMSDTCITKRTDGRREFTAKLSVTKEFRHSINRKTDLVIAMRLRINPEKNHYFPYPTKENKKRYFATRISLKQSIYRTQGEKFEQEEKLVFGSIADLVKKDIL